MWGIHRRRGERFADALVLRPGANSLNLLRLLLASFVIASHSIILGGFGREDFLGNQALGSLAVDAFFGISGFLICASALRHTSRLGRWAGVARYLWDRFLRIFPAFWLCLIVTAVFFGAIGWLATHQSLSGYGAHPLGPAHYVATNSLLRMRVYEISGTPVNVPNPLVWNGSLWTLEWEFLCYLGIGLLAVLGLLARRMMVLVIAVVAWLLEVGLYIHPVAAVVHSHLRFGVHFAPIFLVGALLYLYWDRIPDSGVLALCLSGIAVIGLATGTTNPLFADWLTGPALVYPVLWLGAHLPFRRVGAKNDISYGMYIYGFPVGQLLVIGGVQRWGYVLYMLATLMCTVPFAVASWWGLEKWALRARSWSPLKRHQMAVRPASNPG